MKLLDKVKALFSETEISAEKVFVKTKDGLILSVDGELKADAAIAALDEAGTEVALEDGDYILEDDSTVTVKGGLIVEVKAAEAPVVEEEVTAAETPVEEVAKPVLEAGDYTLDNGDVITVDESGMVVNVVKAEPKEEVAAELVEMAAVVDPRIAELEAELELKNKEIKVAKEAFEKLKAEPAATPLDTRKFEKTEVKKANNMISKVSEIINKK